MKAYILFCLYLILSIVAVSQAQTIVSYRTINGNDWNKLDNNGKLIFITGFMSGSDWVATNSIVSDSIFGNDEVRQKATEIWDEDTHEFDKYMTDPKIQQSYN